MDFPFGSLYIVLAMAPGRAYVEAITPEVEDAVAAQSASPHPCQVHELDIEKLALFLIDQGLSRRV